MPVRMLHSCRRALQFAAVGLAVLATVGCGGGSSSSTRSAPTAQTRSRLASLQNQQLRALSQSGVQTQALASARNGAFASTATLTVGGDASGGGAGSAAPGAGNGGTQIGALPLIGAFITNVATVRPTGTAMAASLKGRASAAHRTRTRRHTREDGTNPNFYFDDYLGLWVAIQDAATSSSFLLYLDEAKTQPAGSFQTTFSANEAFPQTYESHYSITAGALKGTHGDYVTVQNADNSGTSTYNDTYLDGWSDKGKSAWNADGSSTWSSRSDGPNNTFYSYQGSFKADGSGANHTASSDGYVTDYVYNADGSSSGRIQGHDPGLPAIITCDIYGNTTIHYADGSVEYYPGWGFFGGGLVASDGTTSDSGTGSTGAGTISGGTSNGL